MLRLLVADDHPVVRQGVRQIVGETSDMVVSGEASNGQEVLDKARENEYDVVLLDISMPDISGTEILRLLRIQRRNLPILVLSIHPEDQYGMRALRAGASGYLTKDKAPDELITAIRKVSIGGRYVTNSLAERLALDVQGDRDRLPHETLSDREDEVMHGIVSGKRTTDIARELSLSAKTVSTYRRRILEKMKLKDNAELTQYARQYHLLD